MGLEEEVEGGCCCCCCWIADKGSLCPKPNIDCRGMYDMWGWSGWLLLYPETLGCEAGGEIIFCLLFVLLLFTMEGITPGKLAGGVTPAGPNWTPNILARSATNLCLVLSTCSHSFIKKVSTSANCFSFSSSLFNCCTNLDKTENINFSFQVKCIGFKPFQQTTGGLVKCSLFDFTSKKNLWPKLTKREIFGENCQMPVPVSHFLNAAWPRKHGHGYIGHVYDTLKNVSEFFFKKNV